MTDRQETPQDAREVERQAKAHRRASDTVGDFCALCREDWPCLGREAALVAQRDALQRDLDRLWAGIEALVQDKSRHRLVTKHGYGTEVTEHGVVRLADVAALLATSDADAQTRPVDWSGPVGSLITVADAQDEGVRRG